MPSKHLSASVALTVVLAAARLSQVPPLSDAATGEPVRWASLAFPWAHLLLTPWAALADLLTCNSLRQDAAFLGWVLLLFILWRVGARRRWRSWRREAVLFLGALGSLALFAAWAVYFPRAAARLELDDPSSAALDFHSHTNFSWDGVRGFSPERSALWHESAGYQGAFLTDHGNRRGVGAAHVADPRRLPEFSFLEGEEIGLARSHILLLGPGRAPDPKDFAQDDMGLSLFLQAARRSPGVLTVMSLPEYWRHHWELGLERFADAGVRGFEIVSGSPKALDFPSDKRRAVVELCRRRGLFMTGGSDNHGYARAACVWSVMSLPGWRSMDAPARERAVLESLARERFNAVQVLVRTRSEPAEGFAIILDTPRAAWTALRAFNGEQSVSLLLWIWLPFLIGLRGRWKVGLKT